MGPGGLWEAYPLHPPSLAMTHAAQARVFLRCGFFCSSVLPCRSLLIASSTSISSGEKAKPAASTFSPSASRTTWPPGVLSARHGAGEPQVGEPQVEAPWDHVLVSAA